MAEIEADYLVIGAGASGMAFTDSLISDADVDVVMVDRRHKPGGHWNDAYPFVRLHQPSATYGVNSRPLGTETINATGPNAGFYERPPAWRSATTTAGCSRSSWLARVRSGSSRSATTSATTGASTP